MAIPDPSLAIHQAAKDGEVAILSKASKKELNQGDLDGWTAVHWCAWTGHPEPLETVLKRGANPNKVDIRGCTPLHIAATYGNDEALELLIEYKANMWALDNRGLYPAKVAAFNKRLDCCRILDNISLQVTAVNPDFVQQQQKKALKDLQKRIKAGQKQVLKKHSNSLPRLRANSQTRKESADEKKAAAEPNFVLQRPEENEEDTSDEEDDELREMVTISGRNTLRPLPKITSGAMLNTFSDLVKRPMNIEYPDDAPQASNSDTNIVQRRITRRRHGSGKAITQVVPLDTTELELENDSPLATFLHSLDLYDVAQVLLREKMDLDSLSLCSEDDLQKVGLHLGPVKKIHEAMLHRNKVIKTTGDDSPMIDTDL